MRRESVTRVTAPTLYDLQVKAANMDLRDTTQHKVAGNDSDTDNTVYTEVEGINLET